MQPLQVHQPALSHTSLIAGVQKLPEFPPQDPGLCGGVSGGASSPPFWFCRGLSRKSGKLVGGLSPPRPQMVRMCRSPLPWCPPNTSALFRATHRLSPEWGVPGAPLPTTSTFRDAAPPPFSHLQDECLSPFGWDCGFCDDACFPHSKADSIGSLLPKFKAKLLDQQKRFLSQNPALARL